MNKISLLRKLPAKGEGVVKWLNYPRHFCCVADK